VSSAAALGYRHLVGPVVRDSSGRRIVRHFARKRQQALTSTPTTTISATVGAAFGCRPNRASKSTLRDDISLLRNRALHVGRTYGMRVWRADGNLEVLRNVPRTMKHETSRMLWNRY
jgi:hypothetical protein